MNLTQHLALDYRVLTKLGKETFSHTGSINGWNALVDLGYKNAFNLLLKEAWNPEQDAMGNSTLPTVCDKLNIMSAIHNRKLIAALARELKERHSIIERFEERFISIENQLEEINKAGAKPKRNQESRCNGPR